MYVYVMCMVTVSGTGGVWCGWALRLPLPHLPTSRRHEEGVNNKLGRRTHRRAGAYKYDLGRRVICSGVKKKWW